MKSHRAPSQPGIRMKAGRAESAGSPMKPGSFIKSWVENQASSARGFGSFTHWRGSQSPDIRSRRNSPGDDGMSESLTVGFIDRRKTSDNDMTSIRPSGVRRRAAVLVHVSSMSDRNRRAGLSEPSIKKLRSESRSRRPTARLAEIARPFR